MPDSPPATDPLQLKTLDANGKPPKARLKSAKQAQDIFLSLKEAAQPRLTKASVIQGMFDGNPPYNPTKLRQHGQGWRPNFSTLEGPARKESAKTPYYDLFSSASMYSMATTRATEKEGLDGVEAGGIRSEEFDAMLRSWPNFDVQFWRMLDDFIAFNKGFLWWPKRDSWHFKHIPWQRVFFPDGTTIDTDEWELFAIEHQWPVHKLYEFIQDENLAKAGGWKAQQVVKAIKQAVPKSIGSSFNNPMEMQAALRDSELYTSIMSSTVQAASVYVREFDGTWTRIMVQIDGERKNAEVNRPMSLAEATAHQQGEEAKNKKGDDDWLYFKQGVADHVNEILCPFVFEPGTGAINSTDGMGKKLIAAMQAKDRMRCEQVSSVFMRNSILLQATTAGARAKTGLIQHGPVTIIPEGYAVQQGSILGDLEGTLAVNTDLDRMLDVNTGTYRPQFEKPTGNPESATAANIRFSQATVLTNSAVNRFYVQLDKFYEECYRRATLDLPDMADAGVKSAKEFQKRCRDRGLSKKQIQDRQPGAIRAMRTIGNGSPIMRQQTVAAVGGLVPFLGPRGLRNWKVAFASAWGGQQLVEQLLPDEDEQQKPTRDDYDATGENADFQTGAPALLMEEQDHEVHAKVHLTAGVAAIQAAGQGADPANALTFLNTMMPHVAEHIGRVPRENVKQQLEQHFKMLQQEQQKLLQIAKKQQAEAQAQQGQPNEIQLKMMEAQAKLQIDKQKADQDAALKERELQHEIQLDEKRFEHESKLQTQKAQVDIQTQQMTAKAGVEIDQQRAQAQNKIAEQKARQQPKGKDNG